MPSLTSFPPYLCTVLNDNHPCVLNYFCSLTKFVMTQSHIAFISRCINLNVILHGFCMNFNPCIVNLTSVNMCKINSAIKTCSLTIISPPASGGVMKFEIKRINERCIQFNIPFPHNDECFMDDRF
jgi:hypothetical protein